MAVNVAAVAAPCLTGVIGGLAYTTSKHAVVGIPCVAAVRSPVRIGPRTGASGQPRPPDEPDQSETGPYRMAGVPRRAWRTPMRTQRPAPLLGEHGTGRLRSGR